MPLGHDDPRGKSNLTDLERKHAHILPTLRPLSLPSPSLPTCSQSLTSNPHHVAQISPMALTTCKRPRLSRKASWRSHASTQPSSELSNRIRL